MPLDLAKFIESRPRLFHLTARSNVALIRRAGRLETAARLLDQGGRRPAIRERRRDSLTIPVGGREVHIRDQAPLHSGNMSLAAGWTFADFVAHLNEHVFFWPGTEAGPISYGRRHFERYADEDNLVLVLDTAAVVEANRQPEIRFCRYNSGSPRCTGGKPSPRGPGTFVTSSEYAGVPSSVVEVVFRGGIVLPARRLAVVAPESLRSATPGNGQG